MVAGSEVQTGSTDDSTKEVVQVVLDDGPQQQEETGNGSGGRGHLAGCWVDGGTEGVP